ncbi:sigma-70 family RNA polymerase sigma factor [Nonomuraea sp. NPDC023979]|uniref:RNA polymerase sigma factor n=1 Tax=Nonomuraea sp. NPDC023979 TaxID=3154796 RepID=UPI0033D7EB8B
MWSLSDESLIAAIAAGEAEATVAFVRRYQARVYGLALSVVGDPGLAEEVAQDAFVRAWRHAARYDPGRGRVSSWLLTITRNLAVDALRLRRDQPVDPAWLPSPRDGRGDGGDDGREALGEVERVRDELRVLPAELSRPILLSVCYGLTAAEIASREGLPLGTVKTRIRRGLARLRQAAAVP